MQFNSNQQLFEETVNQEGFEFFHFITYVNCPNFLLAAALSTVKTATETGGLGVIIDNRTDLTQPAPEKVIAGSKAEKAFVIVTPDVPLTTAQSMNFMLRIATKMKAKFFTWIHGDGEVSGNPLTLIEECRKRNSAGEKWGVLFTLYDVYCAFNTEACNAIGDWDWLWFPFYFLDNDYYTRLKRAGYPCIDIGGDGIIHHNNASNTIKNDKNRQLLNHYLFPVCEELFKQKYPDGTE